MHPTSVSAKAAFFVPLILVALVVLMSSGTIAEATISTIAGNTIAGFNGDNIKATQASVNYPWQVAVDPDGNLYIADRLNHRIRRVDNASGIITTVAGFGRPGFEGDGSYATIALFNQPYGLTLDPVGRLLIADSANHRIRRVDLATGIIDTVADTGRLPSISQPITMAVDSLGNPFVVEVYSRRILKLDASTYDITVAAGVGETPGVYVSSGDGGPATLAHFAALSGMDFDASGNLYVTDEFSIRRIDAATGIITRVAGDGRPIFAGDGLRALQASFSHPSAVALDANGNLFIADASNRRIRRVDATTGIVTTAAGNGLIAIGGDGGPARLASFLAPVALRFGPAGELVVTDQFRIRSITPLDLNANSILGVSPGTLPAKPKHEMVDVTVSIADTTICSSPSVELMAVTSSEADDEMGPADGHTVNDIQGADIGTADFNFRLRNERSKNGTGRVYEADYLVTCGAGQPGERTVSSVFVIVP